MSEACGNPWRDTPEATRTLLQETARSLLHDWIKYMEMRLLSIDWSNPPGDAATVFRRAVLQTRRSGGTVRGVREIWDEARRALSACGEAEVARLVDDLEADVQALYEMAEWRGAEWSRPGAGVEARVRRPGARLRTVLAELS